MRASFYDAGRSTNYSRPAWIQLGIASWGYAPPQIEAARTRRALSLSLEAALRDAHRAPQWTDAVPLYAPGDHHALRAGARIAHRALDCPAHTTEYAQ